MRSTILSVIACALLVTGCTDRVHLIEQAHVNPVDFDGYSFEISIGAVYRGHGSPCAVTRPGYYTQFYYLYLKEDPRLADKRTIDLAATEICVTTHRFNRLARLNHLSGHIVMKYDILTIVLEGQGSSDDAGGPHPEPFDLNGDFILKQLEKEY